ncbi:hypothetical protein GYMLUDRAFT_43712 [Collybiopsis luxurians FD-317 M1]|uniref:DUF6697 domain-containing protein n=1 Tax=Collybiopsis luxurians FD-317 M1 TaxID=944289 RepID=A0A0D0CD29_9AGAR|nr:hypothetical protein GYMLUDRAFT_43712 [Collybiopsis luxurians FD-317 M1]
MSWLEEWRPRGPLPQSVDDMGYGDAASQYYAELQRSRQKYRYDIETSLMREAKLHARVAALEKEREELKARIFRTRRDIQAMEKLLQGDPPASNEVEYTRQSNYSKQANPDSDSIRALIDISDDEHEGEVMEKELDSLSASSTLVNEDEQHPGLLAKRCRYEPHSAKAVNYEDEGLGKRRKRQEDTDVASSASSPTHRVPSSQHPNSSASNSKSVSPAIYSPQKTIDKMPQAASVIRINGDAVISMIQRSVAAPEVDRTVPRVTTTRRKICGVYGGWYTHFETAYPILQSRKDVNFRQIPGASQKHRKKFIFPRSIPELSEHFPARPGAHGLMFGMKSSVERLLKEQSVCELFGPANRATLYVVEKPTEAPIKYYGVYKIIEARSMTKAEFNCQTTSVQRAIAAEITNTKTGGSICYLYMKARIASRTKGKKFVQSSEEIGPYVHQRRKLYDAGSSVKIEDVLRDLRNGNERLPILVLECIKYDVEIAKAINHDCSKLN